MAILVDYRMGSVDLIPHLPPELTKKHILEAGDIAFFGHGPDGQFTVPIGIEYKKITEAIGSFINKRFVGEQYPKMAPLYKRIYFILEGEYKEGPDGTLLVRSWVGGKPSWTSHGWGTSYRAFDNWQNSLAETGRIRFKRTLDKTESASAVLDLYYMWTKEYDQHKSLWAFDESQTPTLIPKAHLRRRIAARIPGIAWELSGRASSVFPNSYELVTASEEQWMSVKGIGKNKAKAIYKILREE